MKQQGTDLEATILVVDDEAMLANAYAHWLKDEYRVLTAYNGEEALEQLDESVDVVLLDRQMPKLSGAETLARIREADYDCRIAIVTADEPDFDILEMEFDQYLVKPVSKDDLQKTVAELLALAAYDDQVQEVLALAERRATLKTTTTKEDRENNEEFKALQARLNEARAKLDETGQATGEVGLTGTFGD